MGTTDLAEAENWITLLELVFEALMCLDEEKEATVTLLLGERALQWWLTYKRRRPNQTVFIWAEFREAFDQKFMSQIYRDEKHQEFLSLTQGNLTVADYEAKFTDLGRYAPSYMNAEHEKCRRFEQGLRDEIRNIVTVLEFSDFTELVEAALRVEISLERQKKRLEKFKKRSAPSFQTGDNTRPAKKSNTSSSSGSSTGSQNEKRPRCPTCKRYHFGECRAGLGAGICYHCQQPGHYMKECPQLAHGGDAASQFPAGVQGTQAPQKFSAVGSTGNNRGGSSDEKSKGGGRGVPSQLQAQAFAMTQQEVVETPDIITGTAQIYGIDACVLIDPGSTHSYVATSFNMLDGVYATKLAQSMVVTSPIGSSIVVKVVYEGCDVRIDDLELAADLIPMRILEFDTILGMDWLATHHAHVIALREDGEVQ
ncbi:hypothetical protein J5N97_013121 [Dioscorea zingiberensis]|uniref:CCHC-type domain-containing protein n=1 Tax=Dioscorea zingiberensis TaxID=325984 RepID=A0A9D5CRK1_9LILI|nr:hypothetical protein J5N97_013121 [Dioscorea zingiberensis]